MQQGLRNNWKQFWLLVLINAFVGSMVGLERSVLPGFGENIFNINGKTALLSFIIAFGTSKALANLLMGKLTQYITRKQALMLGWFVALPVPFLLMYATSWNWVIFANILLGINQGLAWSSTVIMKIDLVGEKNRGLAMGINEFAGYLSVGVAAYLSAGIADAKGFAFYPFIPGIVFSIAGFFLTLFFVKDTAAFLHSEAKNSNIPLLKNIWKASSYQHRNMGSVTINGLVNNLNDGITGGLLPILLLQKNYSLSELGLIAGIYPVVWGTGQLFTGKLADLYCKKQLITTGMLIQAVALIIITIASSIWLNMLAIILLGIGTALVYPNFLTVIADNTHPNQRAQSMSIFRFWRDSGYVIGAVLSGIVADRFGIPQIHFSPEGHWMNDPNGMVYSNGTYHLFYQYFPNGTTWRPMHWGHATSKNMVHWKHEPIALYPDSLGYIFSGSAVVDANNTSGFGKKGKAPLVAIFTHHDPKGEKALISTYQNQSIAYSLDDGKTWTKYANNPVLKNPGIKDFRDPKVTWYEAGKKWIMTLATLDHITFYSSPDLKNWTKESEFGKEVGAHGGVWECPDLFTLNHNGQQVWILVVNLNPGGPNGGSATQYFTGQFDGHTFTPYQTDTRWLDYGPDEYAGITYSNTGDRKIFLGWMSNWQYANIVPTDKWRSAMTIPRDLGLEKIGEKYLVTSRPSMELNVLNSKTTSLQNVSANNFNLTEKTGKLNGPARLSLTSDKLEPFTITLSNDAGENVLVGYDKVSNNYFIDRTNSGKVSFEKGFAKRHTAPRFSTNANMDMTLIIDNASIELFADDGLSVMTEIFFPNSLLTNISIQSGNDFKIRSLRFNNMKSIWR